MANEVKILINAVDNASSVTKGVGLSFTELNQALQLTQQVLGYVDKAFDATVGQFLKYADQVEDLSRVTGMSADETSRLIQVADDLFVEYGTLTAASRILASQGIRPTIDMMAELSDKYLSFTDKNAQATWAVKTFGRQYAEVTKILEAGGAAIRDAAANQPAGLILSEADLENNKQYKQQIDGLNDSMQALGNTLSKGVLPYIVAFVDGLNTILSGDFSGKTAYTNKVLQAQAAALSKVTGETRSLEGAQGKQAAAADALANMSMNDLYNTLNDIENKTYEVTDATSELTDNLDTTGEITGYWAYMMDNASYSASNLEQIARQANEAISEQYIESQAAAKSIGTDLAGAYATLEAAQQGWYDTVAGDVVANLQSMGLNADITKQAIAGVDSVFGTNYLVRENYLDDIEAINLEFSHSQDMDAYKEALGKLAEKYEFSLAPGVKAAQAAVDNLNKALDLLNGKTVTATVIVNYQNTGDVPDGTSNSPSAPGSDTNRGSGNHPKRDAQGNPLPDEENPFGGSGGNTFNFFPATEKAGRAVAGAVVAQARASRTATRMGG
jgi:hypothetical protein